MADIVDPATRSRMMSGIQGKNTKPELLVRKYLHNRGLRYRLHVKNLPGKPDIVLPKYRTIVFIHGCFWHQHHNCKFATTPDNRSNFWANKLAQNVARDQYQVNALKESGWRILIVWECELRNGTSRLEALYNEITQGKI